MSPLNLRYTLAKIIIYIGILFHRSFTIIGFSKFGLKLLELGNMLLYLGDNIITSYSVEEIFYERIGDGSNYYLGTR